MRPEILGRLNTRLKIWMGSYACRKTRGNVLATVDTCGRSWSPARKGADTREGVSCECRHSRETLPAREKRGPLARMLLASFEKLQKKSLVSVGKVFLFYGNACEKKILDRLNNVLKFSGIIFLQRNPRGSFLRVSTFARKAGQQ